MPKNKPKEFFRGIEKRPFPKDDEEKQKTEIFDLSISPREWMAKNGHNILCGDWRLFQYEDKEFEKWIYEAFEARTTEGLKKLWNEFLTEDEIKRVKELYENP